MALIQRIPRPQRGIPKPGDLDAISMAGRAVGNVRMNPDGIVARGPQIDARGFIDESRGMATIGEGVASVGTAMSRLGEEQARAVADRQARDAEGVLGQIGTELATAITTQPDELQWGGILEDHLQKARTAIESQKMMSVAKVDALDKLTRWESQQRHNITLRQAQQSFANAGRSIKADYTRKVDAKDFAGARSVMESDSARLYLGEDVAAAQLGQLGRTQVAAGEKAAYDMHFAALANDPTAWKEKNAQPWKGREELWGLLKKHADARQNKISVETSDKAMDMIAGGQITVPTEIDALELPGLTPVLREKMKASLMVWDGKKSDEEKRVNGEANWLAMWKEARTWEGGSSDEAAEEYFDMMTRTRYGVPDDAQGQIASLLSAKMGANRQAKPSTETEKAADRIMDTYWKDGTFNGGKSFRRLNPDTLEPEDDPAAVRNAAGVDGVVRQKVRQYLEAHPDTTPEQVQGIIQQSLPEGARAAVMRNLQGALNFGGVMVPKSGDIGRAGLSVFGGPNDPEDNGLSAFGGTTGKGGREGVAVPAKILRHVYGPKKSDWEKAQAEVTFPNGAKEVLPIADLGTAEWVWEKKGKPIMDLTPGAVEQLGGEVVYGKNGSLKGIKGLKNLSFRLLPFSPTSESQTPPFLP